MARRKQDRLQRFLLGLNLRSARKARQLKAVEVVKRTGLSQGYLTEIEKGEKFPSEKNLHLLAETLGIPAAKLTTTQPGSWQHQLHQLLLHPSWRMLPLELFGFTAEQLAKPLEKAPRRCTALLNTLAEVARGYDMGVESLLHLMLRSYQEAYGNHFPQLETAATALMRREKIRQGERQGDFAQVLIELAQRRFGIRSEDIDLKSYPELREFRSVWIPQRRLLWLNPYLSASQRAFQVGREIGYQELELKARGLTSSRVEVESFDQVLNDFRASYFAGALLIPEANCTADIRRWLSWKRWQPQKFLKLMANYGVTPEIFFYRLSQLIPAHFGLPSIHFMRFTESHDEEGRQKIELTKHLNLSGVTIPTGINLNAHFCRHWLAVNLFRQPREASTMGQHREVLAHSDGAQVTVAAQRSRLVPLPGEPEEKDVFLCVGMMRGLSLSPGGRSSVTLGFRLTPEARERIAFSADPKLPERHLGSTCERCPLTNSQCAERQAPPLLHQQNLSRLQTARAMRRLLETS